MNDEGGGLVISERYGWGLCCVSEYFLRICYSCSSVQGMRSSYVLRTRSSSQVGAILIRG